MHYLPTHIPLRRRAEGHRRRPHLTGCCPAEPCKRLPPGPLPWRSAPDLISHERRRERRSRGCLQRLTPGRDFGKIPGREGTPALCVPSAPSVSQPGRGRNRPGKAASPARGGRQGMPWRCHLCPGGRERWENPPRIAAGPPDCVTASLPGPCLTRAAHQRLL